MKQYGQEKKKKKEIIAQYKSIIRLVRRIAVVHMNQYYYIKMRLYPNVDYKKRNSKRRGTETVSSQYSKVKSSVWGTCSLNKKHLYVQGGPWTIQTDLVPAKRSCILSEIATEIHTLRRSRNKLNFS